MKNSDIIVDIEALVLVLAQYRVQLNIYTYLFIFNECASLEIQTIETKQLNLRFYPGNIPGMSSSDQSADYEMFNADTGNIICRAAG